MYELQQHSLSEEKLSPVPKPGSPRLLEGWSRTKEMAKNKHSILFKRLEVKL